MKKQIKGKPDDAKLVAAYQANMKNNAQAVLVSRICGCPHCGLAFPTGEITDWAESKKESMTALCPHCGFADVVPEASGLDLSEEALAKVGKILFPNDRSVASRAYKLGFISLYDDDLLNETARNEALFLQYSSDFACEGNPYALTRIGLLYEFGSPFTKIDYKAAFSYYASDGLAGDGFALARLGRCLEGMGSDKNNFEDAFRCYAHSSALGSDYGKMYIGDCFLKGLGVKADREAAAGIYMSLFHSVYKMFVESKGNNPHILPELCYRIARLLVDETDRDFVYMALRYALIGQYALTFKRKDPLFKHYPLDEMDKEFRSILDRVGGEFGAVADAPYFDVNCFFDTFDVFGDEGYLDQGPGRIAITPVEGSRDSYYLEINMASDSLLVVDMQALYCGFHSGPTHWLFDGVAAMSKKRRNFYFLNASTKSRNEITFESMEGEAHDLTFYLKENDEDGGGSEEKKRKGEA